MNSNKKILEDFKLNVKIRLSLLWVTAMLLYIYGDIISFYVPGFIDMIVAGQFGPLGPTKPLLLLLVSIFMAIPGVMVFLSLILKPNINRLLNIILGLLNSAVMLFTMFMGTFDPWWTFYMFMGVVEVVITLSIAWNAWKWPKQEIQF